MELEDVSEKSAKSTQSKYILYLDVGRALSMPIMGTVRVREHVSDLSLEMWLSSSTVHLLSCDR